MPEARMRAAIFHEFGSPKVVRLEQIDTPIPSADEVLIEVRAAAFNHLDLWVRRGIVTNTTMPHIGGSDIAGIVVQVGDDVESVALGTRVVVNPLITCAHCRYCTRGDEPLCPDKRIVGEHINGGFAEFVTVPERNVYEIPQHISFQQAACLPISYQTAWRALLGRARLKPGEEVLVLGASGGTAIAAIQIAKLAGATVYGVTSGPENTTRVRALGVDRVFDRLEADFSRSVYESTGKRGVDIIVENVGAPTWTGSIRALSPGGRLVTYGATAGHTVELDLRRLFWRQLELIGSTLASYGEFQSMLRVAWAGRLEPVIDTVFPLAEASAAHEYLESGKHFGKVLLEP